MAAASLAVRVSAQTAEFQKSFADMTRTVDRFANEFQATATKAATIGAFFGTIGADIATSLARGIGSAISDAVRLSSEFANAFTGLSSVASAFGTDADTAAAAARALASDGLLPVKDAATGLKNLLATGFSLDEATKLMNAFKDSAAFGRQGALSFGDAVRSATEGVKNGNSILVDNAGITKNLSQILKEAGKSAQDLSKASSDTSVRQALLNGILKEASAFTGDAAKLTQTYAGQLSKLTSQYNTALATIGDVVTQNKTLSTALGFVGDEFGRLTSSLSNNGDAYWFVSGAVIGFIRAMSGLAGAVVIVQRAFTVLDNVMNVTILSMALGVKALTDILVQIVAIGSKLPGSTAAFAAFSDELLTLGKSSSAVNGVVESMQTRIRNNHASMVGWEKTVGGLRDRLSQLADGLEGTRGEMIRLGTATTRMARETASGVAITASEIRKMEAATWRVIQAAEKRREAEEKAGFQIRLWTGRNMEALRDYAEEQRRALPALTDYVNKVDNLSGAYERNLEALKRSAGPMGQWAADQDHTSRIIAIAVERLENEARALYDAANAFAAFGHAVGGNVGGIISGIGGMVAQFEALKKAQKDLAASGTASWGQQASATLGYLSLITAGVSAVVQFAERNDDKIRARMKFIQDQGGSFAFQNRGVSAGVPDALKRLQKASPGSIPRVLEEINRQLEQGEALLDRYGLSWRDLDKTVRQSNIDEMTRQLLSDWRQLSARGVDATSLMAKGLSNLVVEAVNTGTKIPVALQPMLDSLIKAGKLTEDAAAALLGMTDTGMPALADIKDAADRYGLSLDQLGPKVKQLEISETAAQVVKDFELLILAGADAGTVMEAMKDKVQGMVTAALTLGLSLPESMRPMLEQMIKAGLLTDEAGQALTDTGKIQFAKPLADQIELLIEKLGELIDQFSRVDSAAEQLAGRRRELLGQAPAGSSSGSGGGTARPRPPRGIAEGEPAPGTYNPSFAAAPTGAQYITVQVGEDVIARASARGMPRQLSVYGV